MEKKFFEEHGTECRRKRSYNFALLVISDAGFLFLQ